MALDNWYEDGQESAVSWDGHESETSELAWRSEVLSEWRVPCGWETQMYSTDGVRYVKDSELVRLNVQESVFGPYRQRFTRLEADEQWTPLLYLYVHPECVASSRRYVLERAEEPHRTRIRWDRDEKPQARDTTAWAAPRTPFREFYALPEPLHGLTECHVDWTSAPDRYMITQNHRPAAAWLRCFRFFAYTATKYHLLVKTWPRGSPLSFSYRLVPGHRCPVDAPWRCAFAFFAFDHQVPGTNQYTVQSSYEGLDRLRVGMTASDRSSDWADEALVFYAHDVPIPGTSRLNVQYRVRDGTNIECEQNRVSIDNALGPWIEKFCFYAYPAPTVDLEDPPPEASVAGTH